MPLLPGSILGPYEIVSLLGSGAMGDVYVAKDPRLGREVAIKVLAAHHARDPELTKRFEREVKVVAALSHPNILVIHDFGTTDAGLCFAVMELLQGETLRSLINQRPLAWGRALEIAIAVAEGLSAAHSKGVIHRDLKPENIFLTSLGSVKILDFGLAKIDPLLPKIGGSDQQTIVQETLPGTILGTIHYMAPEQMRGNTVDMRSDIFSFGCVLYEMLTGKKPFARSTPADTMAAILREDPAEMESGVFLPAEMKRVIDACLEKNPERRIANAPDLINALRRVGTSSIVLDARLLNPSAARRRKRKAIDSLAILPFTNASGDGDAEYLSDGITEGIINSLSRLPGLRVMALSTVLRYKGRESDPITSGQQLGVRAVITGRVVLRGENMSVQTELVDVIDGSQLWGERYTRRLCDIFDMPEEIAKEISDKLRLKLVQEEKQRLVKRHTENPAAFQLYLKGRFHWNKRTREGFHKAMEYFQEAITEDPQYALAYSGLSDCYSLLAGFGYMDPREGYTRAKEFAQKALQIDDTLSEAYSSLAIIKYRYDWDWESAEKDFRRAIELNPGYPYARHWFAVYLVMIGRFEEAFVELERSLALDPLSLVMNWTKGYLLYYMRRYDESIDQLRRTLELEPNFVRAHFDLGITYILKEMYEEAIAEFKKWIETAERNPGTESLLGYAYAASGRRSEALEMIEHLKAQSAGRYVSNYSIAMIYVALADKDQAFEWLEKSLEVREDPLISLKINPRLDFLRDDSRFPELLHRVGLA